MTPFKTAFCLALFAVQTTAERSLPFIGPSHSPFGVSGEERVVRGCSIDSDDSEARFALQYPEERDSLSRWENGYLLRDKERQRQSLIVPACEKRIACREDAVLFV